jgi:hypothetical protein
MNNHIMGNAKCYILVINAISEMFWNEGMDLMNTVMNLQVR